MKKREPRKEKRLMDKTSYTWGELTKALASGEDVLSLGWECTHEVVIHRTTNIVEGARIERRKRRAFEDQWFTLIEGSGDAWVEMIVNEPMEDSIRTETRGEFPTHRQGIDITYYENFRTWEEGEIDDYIQAWIHLGVQSLSRDVATNTIYIDGYMNSIANKKPAETRVLVKISQDTGEMTIDTLAETEEECRLN